MKAVMFLLGSGVSIPSGFPSTTEITNQVFTGSNVIRHTNARYYLNDKPSVLEKHETEPYLPSILSLLQSIKNLMESYDKEEPLNYEIIYYFIQQLNSYESGEFLNMALYPFIKEVKEKLNSSISGPTRFIDVFSEAENYIRHTVWRKLSRSVASHQHPSFLSDAINDKDISIVNVSTLNHDLLIEQHLTDKQITFNDGFGSSSNGVRYWENHFTDKNNLLKIHGSINWLTLSPDDGNWFDDKIGIVLDGDIDHAKSQTGGLMRSLPEKEPKILIGTFNKIYEYTESIFSDIYYQFRKLLSNTKHLVVSGYSFGDKGVNNAILEWLYSDRENKIIVIHCEPNRLLSEVSRGAIRKAYAGVAKENFITISKNIQDTSWKEIKTKI